MGAGVVTAPSHLDLSEGHLSLHTTFVQIHTHLQRICQTGTEETWSYQRIVAGYQENLTLPSMGWLGI